MVEINGNLGFKAKEIGVESNPLGTLDKEFIGNRVIIGKSLVFKINNGEQITFSGALFLFPAELKWAMEAGKCFEWIHGHAIQWENPTSHILKEIIKDKHEVFRINTEELPIYANIA